MHSEADFGMKSGSLESIRKSLQESFGIEFALRQGAFFGGDYYLATKGDGEAFRLFCNWAPVHSEAIISTSEYRLILRVERSQHLAETIAQLQAACPDFERI